MQADNFTIFYKEKNNDAQHPKGNKKSISYGSSVSPNIACLKLVQKKGIPLEKDHKFTDNYWGK